MMVDGRPVVIDESRNPGLPNTDYILFVDASNSQLCQSGLSAYATVCQIDTLMDRKNFTREHFGCPTLDGVELESQGAAETASSHFEKRLFLNELMTGSSSFDKIVSPLILSYFQDTGGQSFFPWCNEVNPNKTACLTYANAYGTCGLDKWPMRLPKRYQYFQSIPGVPDDQVAYYGGGDPLVDFCPYWTSDAWIVNVSTTFCNHEENTKFKGQFLFVYFLPGI
ncbi:hypothetical protein FBUS_07949 [Fasciolopsis buskii]|uniref:Leishmanolysin-like peptidase n=1 Tax=Fasciolopsis buskii TaxID=27845 RepID=A0A8E0S2P5_9TREM|nr:hypothetical protein FBUS_07949 [Fasciolopsis buski]